MASMGKEFLGLALAIIGFLGVIIMCALPMWKVTVLMTVQIIYEGLWLKCATQSIGQMQCETYDFMHALPQDLQVFRALVVISIIMALIAILLAVVGGQCTNCIVDEASKAKVTIGSGLAFIIAGVLCLIPACWAAHSIIQLNQSSYNPLLILAQRIELGASLYIGWGAAGLLILGGGLMCTSCPPKEDKGYNVKYSQPRSTANSKAYV